MWVKQTVNAFIIYYYNADLNARKENNNSFRRIMQVKQTVNAFISKMLT